MYRQQDCAVFLRDMVHVQRTLSPGDIVRFHLTPWLVSPSKDPLRESNLHTCIMRSVSL